MANDAPRIALPRRLCTASYAVGLGILGLDQEPVVDGIAVSQPGPFMDAVGVGSQLPGMGGDVNGVDVESGKTVAFVKAVDSAQPQAISGTVSVGERIADIEITEVALSELGVKAPDGAVASLRLGEPKRFELQ